MWSRLSLTIRIHVRLTQTIYIYIYITVYHTKSISALPPPPNYCFLVGAAAGRWFNMYLFLKEAVAEVDIFEQCER